MRCYITDSTELKDPALYSRASELLPDERRRKASSFLFEKDRDLSITAGLYFEFVKRSFGTDIFFGEYGKPLCSSEGINFNLSHSGRYAVCVVSEMPIGIDIEEVGDNDDLYTSVMTPNEQAVFERMSVDERRDVFCRLWTAKESYMKILGTGLTLPPTAFEVLFSDGIHLDDGSDGLMIHQLSAPEGYRISVCSYEAEPSEAEYLSCTELIERIIHSQ